MRVAGILTIGIAWIIMVLLLFQQMKANDVDVIVLGSFGYVLVVLTLVGHALLTGQRNRWFDRFFEGVPAWEILWRFIGISLLLIFVIGVADVIAVPEWVTAGSLLLLLFVFVAWAVGKFNDYFN